MSVIWLTKEELFPMVTAKLEKVDVVLDIGCGIMPQKYVRPLVHICCEPFQQYVEVLQNKVKEEYDRTYVIINGGWVDAVRLFPPKSVDTVFLVDVIEHLEKEEALALLKATESLARRQIALFTPLGFMPQYHADGKDAWGLNGADWQEHKSGWLPEDFGELWEFFAARDYHSTDNLGRELEVPHGAMWAVKTFKQELDTDKLFVSNIINMIFSNVQNKNITLLNNLIRKMMPHTSNIDMKIYTAALNLYVSIKYSKLLVEIVDKLKFTTKK